MTTHSNRVIPVDIRCRDCGEVFTVELSVLRDADQYACRCGGIIPLDGGSLVDCLHRSDSRFGKAQKRG